MSDTAERARIIEAVQGGLRATPKNLPAWLFYDAEGSRLYEQITLLPEYYLTRAERSIFQSRADEIIAAVTVENPNLYIDKSVDISRWSLVELGSGTASKSQLLVQAMARKQGRTRFYPADVSEGPLREAAPRFAEEVPLAELHPIFGHHEVALAQVARIRERVLLLYIGSSIGNYDDAEARALLQAMRKSLRAGDALLLGADLRKDPAVLVRAYDDAQGITAAFNKNILARLNRELGADFQLEKFRHVALWNEAASRIEMHLESLVAQSIEIPACALKIKLGAGERIHTESSVKYDRARVVSLLRDAGFVCEASFFDHQGAAPLPIGKAAGVPTALTARLLAGPPRGGLETRGPDGDENAGARFGVFVARAVQL